MHFAFYTLPIRIRAPTEKRQDAQLKHKKHKGNLSMSIVFKDDEHEQLYNNLCKRMKYLDEYHRTAAYLLSLDDVCREHIANIFDLQEDVIIPEALERAWQTGTSMKTTRLLFNLWNGYYTDNNAIENTVTPPEDGRTVVSTIDVNVQSIVEQEILNWNEAHKSGTKDGSLNMACLIMNPNTVKLLQWQAIRDARLKDIILVARRVQSRRYQEIKAIT